MLDLETEALHAGHGSVGIGAVNAERCQRDLSSALTNRIEVAEVEGSTNIGRRIAGGREDQSVAGDPIVSDAIAALAQTVL